MKNIQKLLLLAVCLCTALTVKAQSLTVTGKVTDPEGLEVIGANITIKGASGVGAISDLSGNYKLKVNNAAKDVLVFSYIGMKTSKEKQLSTSFCKTIPKRWTKWSWLVTARASAAT